MDPKLVGIRGWLIIPAMGLVGAVIGSVGLLIIPLVMFFDHMPYPDSKTLVAFVLLALAIGLALFVVYAASQFFKKKRNAPSVMVAMILMSTGASILICLLAINTRDQNEMLVRLAMQIVAAAVWIPYFKTSKRVKATFVN